MEQWIIQEKAIRGERNRIQGLECQDRTASARCSGCIAIALADGTGRDSYAAQGAQITAQVLAQMLAVEFEQLYAAARMDSLFLQHNILTNILRNQKKLLPDATLRQMQSTALGIAVDTVQNRYLFVHLGDGQICCQRDEALCCLSNAENGFGPCETYLTASHEAFRHVRSGTGSAEGIDAFFLLSDGGLEKLKQLPSMEDFLNYQQSSTDDVSVCRMVRNRLRGQTETEPEKGDNANEQQRTMGSLRCDTGI